MVVTPTERTGPLAGLYIYAVTAAATAPPRDATLDLPEDGAGVGGDAPVFALHRGGLAAVVSPVTGRPRARRRDLRAHQNVLAALSTRGSVLPMRFGVIAPDEETVLDELDAARARHLAALERLAGRSEWNVKGVPDPDGLPDLLREDAGLRTLRENARRRPGYEANVRLGEAVDKGLRRRAQEAGADVLAALRPLAAETRQGQETAGSALNASFLVPRTDEPAFQTAVRALAARHERRIVLTLTGPLPCYSFVADHSKDPAPTPVGS